MQTFGSLSLFPDRNRYPQCLECDWVKSVLQVTVLTWFSFALQVSPEGCTVATFDKHRVIAWSLKGHSKAPLCLKHTKPFTVRPSSNDLLQDTEDIVCPPLCTCTDVKVVQLRMWMNFNRTIVIPV